MSRFLFRFIRVVQWRSVLNWLVNNKCLHHDDKIHVLICTIKATHYTIKNMTKWRSSTPCKKKKEPEKWVSDNVFCIAQRKKKEKTMIVFVIFFENKNKNKKAGNFLGTRCMSCLRFISGQRNNQLWNTPDRQNNGLKRSLSFNDGNDNEDAKSIFRDWIRSKIVIGLKERRGLRGWEYSHITDLMWSNVPAWLLLPSPAYMTQVIKKIKKIKLLHSYSVHVCTSAPTCLCARDSDRFKCSRKGNKSIRRRKRRWEIRSAGALTFPGGCWVSPVWEQRWRAAVMRWVHEPCTVW